MGKSLSVGNSQEKYIIVRKLLDLIERSVDMSDNRPSVEPFFPPNLNWVGCCITDLYLATHVMACSGLN